MLANSLPARKMGVNMGIFNIFIVIPQLLAAAVLSWLLDMVAGGDRGLHVRDRARPAGSSRAWRCSACATPPAAFRE